MAIPKFNDYLGGSSVTAYQGAGQPTVLERILACLAAMASGTNPDGSPGGVVLSNAGVITGSGVTVSLNNVSTTGRGTALFNQNLFSNATRSNHTMVVVSSAGVSAGTVQFQGTLDNVNWFNLGTAVSTTTASTVFPPVVVSNQPIMGIAANITGAITGGTVQAWVASSG